MIPSSFGRDRPKRVAWLRRSRYPVNASVYGLIGMRLCMKGATSMTANAGMTIHVSAKLAKKLHLPYEQSLSASTNPFLDWSADLFTAARTQYILITNTTSLYSIVMYGRGVTNETSFFQDTVAAMRDVFKADGLASIFEHNIASTFYPVALAKRENRGVIGSMNDLIFQARLRLVEQEISPHDTSAFLNGTVMSYIDYKPPRVALQSIAQKRRLAR